MSVPIQLQLFDAFLGTQEGIHSVILPDIFSSGGSLNLYIDKFGRAKKVHGYSKVNSSAVTSDTGDDAVRVRNLFPYRAQSGGSTTRQLIAIFDDTSDEWEIHRSSDGGATWALVEDLGSGSVGKIADFAQFGDDLYVTNGVVVPRVLGTASVGNAGKTQSPTPTGADSGDAGFLSGVYRYKLVSIFDDGTRKAGSAASTAFVIQDAQADVTWTADANTDVVGYELYRTTGTGTIFYFTAYIDGRTTASYVDNTPDLTILENRILEEHGDAPPTGVYYCEPHKQRMWWLRTDTFPTRAWWSDPGEPESVWTENFLSFSDSETVGDIITGALGNFEGLFVVFTERAIWTVSGTGAVIGNITDWTRTRTNAQTGSVHHRTVVRVPAGSKYSDQIGQQQTTEKAALAYLTPLGDIRLFDGDNDLIISHPVKDTLATFNYAQRAKAHAVVDSENDQVIWFIPTGNSGEPDTCLVWNRRWGVWYVWEPSDTLSASCENDTATSPHQILTGEGSTSKGGFIYHFFNDDANSFDDDAILAKWMTKTLHGVNEQGLPAIVNQKRWRWADFLFQIAQDVTLTVEWLNGNAPNTASALGSLTIIPAAEQLVSADGSAVLTADGSMILAAVQSAQEKAILKTSSDYLHDTGIRLRIGDNASNGSWSLEALTLAYQILPGLRRRVQ